MELTEIGATVCLVGLTLMTVCLIVHFVFREQPFNLKVGIIVVILVFSFVMAGLVFASPRSRSWTMIFGSLSLLLPALSILVIGAGMLMYTFLVGIDGAGLVALFYLLSAILALSGSVVTLVGASEVVEK